MSVWSRVRCWRAPSWAPLFVRRAFAGCWTQDEIDAIQRHARERAEEMRRLTE